MLDESAFSNHNVPSASPLEVPEQWFGHQPLPTDHVTESRTITMWSIVRTEIHLQVIHVVFILLDIVLLFYRVTRISQRCQKIYSFRRKGPKARDTRAEMKWGVVNNAHAQGREQISHQVPCGACRSTENMRGVVFSCDRIKSGVGGHPPPSAEVTDEQPSVVVACEHVTKDSEFECCQIMCKAATLTEYTTLNVLDHRQINIPLSGLAPPGIKTPGQPVSEKTVGKPVLRVSGALRWLHSSGVPRVMFTVLAVGILYVIVSVALVLLDVKSLRSFEAIALVVEGHDLSLRQTYVYGCDDTRHLNTVVMKTFEHHVTTELHNLQSLLDYYTTGITYTIFH